MKNLYEQFGTDTNLEQDGVVLSFGGPSFRVRRAGGANRKYKAVFNAKMRPHARALANDSLGEEKSNELLLDIFFDSIMVGWQDVTDREGNELEYNRANFSKLMKDLPDLWGTLREEAGNVKNFQAQTAEEDGNTLGN